MADNVQFADFKRIGSGYVPPSNFVSGRLLPFQSPYLVLKNAEINFAKKELLNQKEINKNLKIIERKGRILRDFGSAKFQGDIALMFQKYGSDPQKLDKESRKLVQKVIDPLKEFNQAYYAIQKELYESLHNSLVTIYLEDDWLYKVLQRLGVVCMQKNIAFPDKVLDDLGEKLKYAFEEQLREVQRDSRDLKKEGQNKSIGGPIGALFFGAGYVTHVSRSAVKKWRKQQINDFRKYLDQLNQQLDSGNVDLSTLSLLLKKVESLTSSDMLLRSVINANAKTLQTVTNESREVLTALQTFSNMFRNIPEVASMHKFLVALNDWSNTYNEKLARKEKYNADQLQYRIVQMMNSVDYAIQYMKRVSAEVRARSSALAAGSSSYFDKAT
jgi:hypothetical protein